MRCCNLFHRGKSRERGYAQQDESRRDMGMLNPMEITIGRYNPRGKRDEWISFATDCPEQNLVLNTRMRDKKKNKENEWLEKNVKTKVQGGKKTWISES